MASRSSGNWLSETYQGTRRGRSTSGDIGWEMFPQKTEVTAIREDPEQLYEDRRAGLRDFTPVQSTLFAHEEARRNTYARDRLELRDGGARTTTDPWQNEGYDTQFHDQDPRGWSTEQPWSEYRRQLEAHLRSTDFKDDGDYSVPERGISPYTMYKQIRGAQAWVQARYKNFETSWEARHAGGVGVYPNVSRVFQSDREDGSVMTEGVGMGTTFEDPVNRQHVTTKLSNIVHLGSKALRANTTTDHKVRVAAYGKLYAQRGLIPHESQLRILEDDTPRQRLADMQGQGPRNAFALMSEYVWDQGNFGEGSFDAEGNLVTDGRGNARQARQLAGDKERMAGMRGESAVDEKGARNRTVTRDIMALLGFVEQDIRYLRELERTNPALAKPLIQNLYQMAETVHKMPAHAKLELRTDLLLRAAGGGLLPGDPDATRRKVEVNPRLLKLMEATVDARAAPLRSAEDVVLQRMEAETEMGRAQGLNSPVLGGLPVLVYSAAAHGDQGAAQRAAEESDTRAVRGRERQVANYRPLLQEAIDRQRAAAQAQNTQERGDATARNVGRSLPMGVVDYYGQRSTTAVEVDFGDNRGMVRHVGPMGDRAPSRAVGLFRGGAGSDYVPPDEMTETTVGRTR